VLELLPGVGGLILAIAAAVLVYLLALKLLRVVPVADVEVMARIIARLPRRVGAPLNSILMQLSTSKC
jgi:hypothetical protein